MAMAAREVTYNLAGTVRNMSLPVAGTTVVLYDFWTTGKGLSRHYVTEQVTGAKGDFAFDVRKGVYSIEIVPNRDTRFARQSVETIKVTRNTTFSVSLKTGSIFSGQVRTAAGDPLCRCEVVLFGIEPHVLRAVEKTDEQGRFSITLPHGKYHVFSRQSGLDKGATPFLTPISQVYDIDRDENVDLTLPELVRFSGSVTNAEGHPASGVKVIITPSSTTDGIFSEEAELKCFCVSDKKGLFGCDVQPGTYDIKLEPGPDSHLSERHFTSIVIDQARSKAFPLGHGYNLYGTILFDGEPMEDALVTVYGGKIDSSALTDEDGNYSFSLSGGTYEIAVTPQPDSLARFPSRTPAPKTISVSLAEDTEKNIELEDGVLLDGKIVDSAGKPRAGVQIAIYPEFASVTQLSAGARALCYGVTGDDGSYEFRVPAGKYKLVLNNQRATAISVEANGERKSAELTWTGACIVDFEVVSELDEPISNCQIVCEPYAQAQKLDPISAVTDEKGSGQLTVPIGIYTFQIDPPEQGSFEGKQIRQLSINTDLRKKIKLAYKA